MSDPIRGPGRAVKSRGPLGGTRGEWRHRVLRFHLPLAVTSGVALLLFMSLPQFDPQAYPQSDMASAGALPVARAAGTMSPSGEQPSGHGAGRPTAGPGGSATPCRRLPHRIWAIADLVLPHVGLHGHVSALTFFNDL
jgi:hypothetical protein